MVRRFRSPTGDARCSFILTTTQGHTLAFSPVARTCTLTRPLLDSHPSTTPSLAPCLAASGICAVNKLDSGSRQTPRCAAHMPSAVELHAPPHVVWSRFLSLIHGELLNPLYLSRIILSFSPPHAALTMWNNSSSRFVLARQVAPAPPGPA